MKRDQPRTAAGMALAAATDLQDDLLTSINDLERLHTLLGHSHETLQAGFFGLLALLQDGGANAGRERHAQEHVAKAVKALQFQDLASQLIAHTSQRLHQCADRLAREAFAGDEEDAVADAAPLRANPVTQSEMHTGFVELF